MAQKKLNNYFFFKALHPYPGDCTKFLHCGSGKCAVITCGTGTVFNRNILNCDYPGPGFDCRNNFNDYGYNYNNDK